MEVAGGMGGPEVVRPFIPAVEAQTRVGAIGSAISAQPASMPMLGLHLGLGILGTALPILGAAYFVRAGVQTVLGQPPQWLKSLA